MRRFWYLSTNFMSRKRTKSRCFIWNLLTYRKLKIWHWSPFLKSSKLLSFKITACVSVWTISRFFISFLVLTKVSSVKRADRAWRCWQMTLTIWTKRPTSSRQIPFAKTQCCSTRSPSVASLSRISNTWYRVTKTSSHTIHFTNTQINPTSLKSPKKMSWSFKQMICKSIFLRKIWSCCSWRLMIWMLSVTWCRVKTIFLILGGAFCRWEKRRGWIGRAVRVTQLS